MLSCVWQNIYINNLFQKIQLQQLLKIWTKKFLPHFQKWKAVTTPTPVSEEREKVITRSSTHTTSGSASCCSGKPSCSTRRGTCGRSGKEDGWKHLLLILVRLPYLYSINTQSFIIESSSMLLISCLQICMAFFVTLHCGADEFDSFQWGTS